MALTEYFRKRDFKKTSEPKGRQHASKKAKQKLMFVVHEHHASHLHYDFRLEWDGTLKSWAVPKGPSLDPHTKRLAVEVEDHPIEYGSFEGVIPENQYGAGNVYIWDTGTWSPIGDAEAGLKKGRLEFEMFGDKLKGKWILVRTRAGSSSKPQWLLMKRTDEFAEEGHVADVHSDDADLTAQPEKKSGKNRSAKKSSVNAKSSETKKTRSKETEAAEAVHPAKLKVSANTDLKKKAEKSVVSKNFIAPALALLVDEPPVGPDWIHETKYDGYRIQAMANGKKVQLFTRAGNDWTDKFPLIKKALIERDFDNATFDGEIVWIDDKGRSDFQKLQNAIKSDNHTQLYYYIFDLLKLDGHDLRELPLLKRKELLKELLGPNKGNNLIRYSDHSTQSGEELLQAACSLHLEGLVSKKANGPYPVGRNGDWVKSKCISQQEFVIGGFTDGTGSRVGLGALLLGVYEKGELRYVGKVGTGFSNESLLDLKKTLTPLVQNENPFDIATGMPRKGVHWVKPKYSAEIVFANWTDDGQLRVPVFHGLREDKPTKEIHEEVPVHNVESVSRNKSKKLKPAKISAKSAAKAETGKSAARSGNLKSLSSADPSTSSTSATKTTSSKSSKSKSSKSRSLNGQIEINEQSPKINSLKLSHPDKILYAKENLTKLDVAQYYIQAADLALPYVKNRPLTLVRCPEGTKKICFYQKHISDSVPEFITPIKIKEKEKTVSYMSVTEPKGLISLVQMGAFELHCWNSTAENLEKPDQIVMDFDPDPSIPWKRVVDAAFELREILDSLGLKNFVKLSGGKGIHVHVPFKPLYSWDQVREFSKALALQLQKNDPKFYVTKMTKSLRDKKIFVDYLRNARGATAVAPYSLRAKENSSVAMPLSWEELRKISGPQAFSLTEALAYLKKRKVDPWSDYFHELQELPHMQVQE